jgi:hypothetical protein
VVSVVPLARSSNERVALAGEPAAGHQPADAADDHGADVHRRSLTADRAAAEQAGTRNSTRPMTTLGWRNI